MHVFGLIELRIREKCWFVKAGNSFLFFLRVGHIISVLSLSLLVQIKSLI